MNDKTIADNSNKPATGLDWYATRESANSILNNLLGYYGSAIIEEESAESPDPQKLADLVGKANEIDDLLKAPGTFKTISSMKAVIEKYGPVIKAINLAARMD